MSDREDMLTAFQADYENAVDNLKKRYDIDVTPKNLDEIANGINGKNEEFAKELGDVKKELDATTDEEQKKALQEQIKELEENIDKTAEIMNLLREIHSILEQIEKLNPASEEPETKEKKEDDDKTPEKKEETIKVIHEEYVDMNAQLKAIVEKLDTEKAFDVTSMMEYASYINKASEIYMVLYNQHRNREELLELYGIIEKSKRVFNKKLSEISTSIKKEIQKIVQPVSGYCIYDIETEELKLLMDDDDIELLQPSDDEKDGKEEESEADGKKDGKEDGEKDGKEEESEADSELEA